MSLEANDLTKVQRHLRNARLTLEFMRLSGDAQPDLEDLVRIAIHEAERGIKRANEPRPEPMP